MRTPSIKGCLIPLFLLALFQGGTIPKKGITDLEKYRLKGKVKSMMETRYTVGEGADSLTKDKILYQKYTEFNYAGYESSYILYKDGKPSLSGNFLFGPEGWQTGLDEYRADGTLNAHVVYFYDTKGFRVKARYRWGENREIGDLAENTDYYFEILNSDLFTIVVYKNEYRGFCLQEDYLRADSTLSFRFVSRYDFHGNKTESSYLHGNEHTSWITKNNYDLYDNLIESKVFKSNRIAVETKYTYQFDGQGNWMVMREDRNVNLNILTEGLEKADMLSERSIQYY
jgi:hypothetical protein